MAKKFFSDVELKAAFKVSSLGSASNQALVVDANGDVTGAAVTQTQIEYLSNVSSDIQGQIDDKLDASEKGAANGIAELDANSKIPSSQLPAIAITEVFVAADITARDALTIGSGDGEIQEGDVVIVTDASDDANITSGSASYIYDGSAYQLLKAGDEVLSVNGETGAVTLNPDHLDDSATTNKFTTQAEIDKLAGIEAGADVTDEDNVTDALDGATLTAATVAGSDKVLIQDADDSDILKTVTAQSIADLASAGTDENVKISANDTTAGYLEDKVVVSSGANSTEILEVSTLNDGGNEDLQIQIDESKIDHDALSNFEANEHIDWTADAGQDIADENISESSVTQHEAALSVTASQVSDFDTEVSNNTDVAANTAARHDAVTIAAGDSSEVLSLSGQEITSNAATDSTAGHMTAADKAKLDSLGSGSAGDIAETSFSFADNQSSAADVTGLAFANGTVRSFRAQVSINRGADGYEVFTLHGIQKAASWEMSAESTGDDTGVLFSITSAGQVQYTSTDATDGGTMKFRAETTSV
jgi:hypothetical protein